MIHCSKEFPNPSETDGWARFSLNAKLADFERHTVDQPDSDGEIPEQTDHADHVVCCRWGASSLKHLGTDIQDHGGADLVDTAVTDDGDYPITHDLVDVVDMLDAKDVLLRLHPGPDHLLDGGRGVGQGIRTENRFSADVGEDLLRRSLVAGARASAQVATIKLDAVVVSLTDLGEPVFELGHLAPPMGCWLGLSCIEVAWGCNMVANPRL